MITGSTIRSSPPQGSYQALPWCPYIEGIRGLGSPSTGLSDQPEITSGLTRGGARGALLSAVNDPYLVYSAYWEKLLCACREYRNLSPRQDHAVEDLRALAPDIYGFVIVQALVIEAVDLRYFPPLAVATD